MTYLIGTDLGTTSTKSVLYDHQGHVIASANVGYPLYHDTVTTAEEDPQEIWQAVQATIHQVSAGIATDEIEGVAFSSAMHSLILLDANKQPLTRVITWADNRAAADAAALKARPLGQQLYEMTGTPIHPMSPLVKLHWFANQQPDLLNQARYVVGIKEYIIYLMTGQLQMDYSMANATGLFNLYNFDWEPAALDYAQVTRAQLPPLVDTDAVINGLTPTAAGELGLRLATKVIMGASDGALSNLGVGADEPGVAAITIGTSGAVRVMTKQPYLDPEGRLFCYYVAPHHWIVGGPINNGGQVFRWVRDELFATESQVARDHQQDPYDQLTALAATVPVGAHGLLFHPYLSGERAPLWNADARGSLLGVTTTTTKADIARAVLEGIVMNLNTVLQLTAAAEPVHAIRATGGFARSSLWRQILTDVLGQPITIPSSFESSCLAAAVIGLKALGHIDDLNAIHAMIGATETYQPNAANHQLYHQHQVVFDHVTAQLAPLYHEIATLNR
ncbi:MULTISPECIES: gluconokinase [Lactiplantibacillus]|uniref:FGGY family carbohydrate kinase n=1 Tax=Lactiplantibacillus pentosus TaxID=1589 RepID=A0AAW8WE79_LACPE|nr:MULTISPECIES: FGGY family carbohydrate kinase [Lactiplantibacillus]MBU7460222.1 gluconate kinase [Lactiplantibacillus pentosus]MBU7477414.1 gluconate kinase [Lactiplantibacillus pentosus]MBU7482922.1 gluconate kinase [Lactiplantibacillus sp. 30.2.29]MBU7488092.1 gluconate kinase [Lactiplantibacillus pentosus]MBU7501192.1 gluconate kinase [Lactiplantibacillus pentosus]